MQLHQIKRAQIYAGPVTDVLLFRRIVDNQSGGRHLANASDLETYDDVIRGEECKSFRFGPKVGQTGPKWNKYGNFSDQISVHFGARTKCTAQQILVIHRLVLFHANLDYF